ncbi:transposase [Microcystis aeruginosa NIES-3807]|uniref:Transposase n=2 Tax=Microcystis aeruginosa TaxID=1126 RepID=A0AAD3B3I1_MICAE|nr:hypothetical protein MiTs_00339 [Microcystis aeruginosa NIES-2521]GCL60417.1 transposase [Microcystis aeruginosa NIES-3807]
MVSSSLAISFWQIGYNQQGSSSSYRKFGLSTVGHTGTFGLDPINTWGENTSTFSEAILSKQVISVNQESPHL